MTSFFFPSQKEGEAGEADKCGKMRRWREARGPDTEGYCRGQERRHMHPDQTNKLYSEKHISIHH